MTHRARCLVCSLIVLVLAAPAVVLAQTEVNTCGQVLTGDGYLSADLDCSGFQDPITVPRYQWPWGPTAVVIANGGALDLRGHTIDCGTNGPSYGVACINKKCSLSGGTITNAGAHGVTSTTKRRVTIQNMTITHSGEEGVTVPGSALIIDSTISDNVGEGVSASAARLIGSTVTGSGEEGYFGSRVKLINSTVTGNSTKGACGSCPNPCADVSTLRRPRLKDSTCGSSLNSKLYGCTGGSFATWHVCAND